MAPAAVAFYGDPTAELRVAGITGTNGKTTTAFLLRHVLERAGTPTGLLGTVKRIVGGVEAEVERTTPEAIDLQRTFREMLDAGDRACAMEVSSHALALRRADGIRFAVAAFTNLTQDHLDFHAEMEDYFAAKALLFDRATPEPPGRRRRQRRRSLRRPPGGSELASAEGAAASRSPPRARTRTTRALDVSFDAGGSRFVCRSPDGEHPVELGAAGPFQRLQRAAAIATAGALGVDPRQAPRRRSPTPTRVPGRIEPIDEGQAVRRARRLRAHARLAGERAAGGAAAHRRAA